MHQLFQNLRTGSIEDQEIPVPLVRPGHVLIRTRKSLVSPGTERMLSQFGKAGLLGKALQQPEKVRQVIQKMKTDGLAATARTVFSRLDTPLPVGYSNVGVIEEVGEGVTRFAVGDRVVSNGWHAEAVLVPENLCARIPDEVSDESAAFTVLGAIALQGIRLVQPQLGESVVVYGLGLIGLLACQMLKANGCRVLGFDIREERIELAKSFGVEAMTNAGAADPVRSAISFSGGYGVDAVLITASTTSKELLRHAPQMCRKRGRIVLVGVAGLELDRSDFYEKEISFQVSCSYGPGRYDKSYEQKGLDYPIGFVRWTEQRNFEAVLELMRQGSLTADGLISMRLPFAQAGQKYDTLLNDPSALGILFNYEREVNMCERVIQHDTRLEVATKRGKGVVGVIGAGNFARATLIPALKKAGAELRAISSATGASSADLARKYKFAYNTTDYREIIRDSQIDSVVIATRHNLHAKLVVEALDAGKHVFVEKPLALTTQELADVRSAHELNSDRVLMVGFNRRYSPYVRKIKELLRDRTEPLAMVMTVNAGALPEDHWANDPREGGGRIVGEVCHFVDLLYFISETQVKCVSKQVARSGKAGCSSLHLDFEDGSIGTIHYFENGHKAAPKEHLQIFCEGKQLTVENFQRLCVYGAYGSPRTLKLGADKGHEEELEVFLQAVAGNRALMDRVSLFTSSEVAISYLDTHG